MDLSKQSQVLFGDLLMFGHFLEKQLFAVHQNVSVERLKDLLKDGLVLDGMLIRCGTVLDPLNHDGNEN